MKKIPLLEGCGYKMLKTKQNKALPMLVLRNNVLKMIFSFKGYFHFKKN